MVDYVSKLGTINWVVCDDGLIVVNAYTQRYFGRLHKELNLDHMRGCFREVKRAFGGHGFSFGFPLIGCDRGKGDWKDVSPIIEEEMLGEKIALYILPDSPGPTDRHHHIHQERPSWPSPFLVMLKLINTHIL